MSSIGVNLEAVARLYEPLKAYLKGAQSVPDNAAFTRGGELALRQVTFGDIRALIAALDAIRAEVPAHD